MNTFRPKVSVCMATFNGARFLLKQLNSITRQLSRQDEIIIVDDASTDETLQVIRGINDSRIKLHVNEVNAGHVFSFERAISLASGDFIFLSDQDDIWVDDRLHIMLNLLNNNDLVLVTGNSSFIDADDLPRSAPYSPLLRSGTDRCLTNIVNIFLGRVPYYGCNMGFRSYVRSFILPFPIFTESHDLWIALCANIMRSSCHLDQVLTIRRIHGGNVTNFNRTIFMKLRSRVVLLLSLFIIFYRFFLRRA